MINICQYRCSHQYWIIAANQDIKHWLRRHAKISTALWISFNARELYIVIQVWFDSKIVSILTHLPWKPDLYPTVLLDLSTWISIKYVNLNIFTTMNINFPLLTPCKHNLPIVFSNLVNLINSISITPVASAINLDIFFPPLFSNNPHSICQQILLVDPWYIFRICLYLSHISLFQATILYCLACFSIF